LNDADAAEAEANLWHPVTACRLPALARWQVGDPERKPRGAARLRAKLVKSAYSVVYRRLRRGGPGRLDLRDRDGRLRSIPIDAANGAFIDFESRRRHGGYAPELTALFNAAAVHADTVYDVGANWGYFSTLLAANRDFAGQVHAFEISPGNAAELGRVIREGGFGARVTVWDFGLSDRDGEVDIVNDPNGHLRRIASVGDRARLAKARVRRLDGIDLPAPQFLKIDAEGHDFQILQGARNTIERRAPVIVFESHFGREADMRQPFDLLAELGYEIYALAELARGRRLRLAPITATERSRHGRHLDLVASHPKAALNDRIVALT
jgi:FkbM family methyltransferase